MILDSETRASEKLRKILELKANYQTLKFIVKSQNDEQTISKLLNQIEADIVSLKHLQVWDNRIQTLEEEIKKFSTSEDFTELKRAVHLLKKGYEIQKISVRDIPFLRIINPLHPWRAS